jgi:hypothetical protein
LTTAHLNSLATDFDLDGIRIQIAVAGRTRFLCHNIVLLVKIDLLEHPKSGCGQLAMQEERAAIRIFSDLVE